MNGKNLINVLGHIVIINDLTNEIVYEGYNKVTNNGLAWIADQLSAGSGNPISHVAVGTGTLNDDGTDTELDSELTRVAITSNTPSSNSFTVVASFGAGVGTGSLTELGLLNASSGGTLIAAKVINITKESTDSYTVNWTFTFTRSS